MFEKQVFLSHKALCKCLVDFQNSLFSKLKYGDFVIDFGI